jgi:hypothetical protein
MHLPLREISPNKKLFLNLVLAFYHVQLHSVSSYFKNIINKAWFAVHGCNLSTWDIRGRKIMRLKPAWDT